MSLLLDKLPLFTPSNPQPVSVPGLRDMMHDVVGHQSAEDQSRKIFYSLWNHTELPAPSILSIPLTCHNRYEVVAEMKILMNNMKQTLHDLKQLDSEAAALSRLIYQLKLKLRHEKSLKVLQKINRCLTNYKTLNLPFIISSIAETLDDSCAPSRQMVEWTLVRMYGVAHLFRRVNLLCTEAVGHLFVKIKLGQLWNMTLIPIAVCSRLWTISQFIVLEVCKWYKSLYPYLDKMEISLTPWLPQGCDLPRDLHLALPSTSNLQSTPLNQLSSTYSELNVDVIASKKSKLTSEISSGTERVADMGVRVSRTSFEEFRTEGKPFVSDNFENNHSNHKPRPTKPRVLNNFEIHTVERQENKITSRNLNATKDSIKCKNKISKTAHNIKSSLDLSTKSLSKYKHSVKAIESSGDLEQFLNYEKRLQHEYHNNGNRSEKPLIRKGDGLKWLPVQNHIEQQLRLINKAEKSGKSDKKEKILQAVKVYIKKRCKS